MSCRMAGAVGPPGFDVRLRHGEAYAASPATLAVKKLLLLHLEPGLVFLDEGADLVGHVEKL